MLNRQVITGTVIVLASLSGPAVKADSSYQTAQHDAREAIENFYQINDDALLSHDDEYIDSYLRQYEQEMATYTTAFNQGYQDALNSEYRLPEDDIARAGYEQGYLQIHQDKKNVQDQGQFNTKEADRQAYQPQSPQAYQAKFIKRIVKAAQQIGKEYDLYPSVIIAQAALESDWGRSTLSRAPYNNLFGVKGYFAQQTVAQPTFEYDARGKRFEVFSNFRRYENEYQALKDYAVTLDNSFYSGVHRQKAMNYRAATRALLGRYATDPAYDQKLNQLIATYQLTKYDDYQLNSDEDIKKMPTINKKTEVDPVPVVSKQPVEAKESHHIPRYIPLLSGLGTGGILELCCKLKRN